MNKINTTMTFLLILFQLGWFSHARAAEITASVDRNPVTIDESFNLRIRARGSVDGEPDLAPLAQDFDVLSTSQSTSMNFVNGQFSREAVWNITLISRQIGIFTIPPISIGKEQSPALRITVKDAASGSQRSQDRSLYLEAETDTERTWVQGQILYTIRLFSNTRISSGSLTPPQTSDDDAIIEQLGDDVSYEAFRNGVRYDVIERRFAIFPQQSGTLEISPTRFEGHTGQSRTLFDQFYNNANSQVKRARSESITVDVLPAAYSDTHWLPASQLNLIEEWSSPTDELQAGEPVTRTITIQASGVVAEQLPELELSDHDQIKQYPDQAQSDNRIDKNGVDSVKKFKIAMIPTAAGTMQLPALDVHWWNTRTGAREKASLPASTLVVSGEVISQNQVETPSISPGQSTSTDSEGSTVSSVTGEQLADTRLWQLVALLLALAWITTLYMYMRRRGAPVAKEVPMSQLRKTVLDACTTNDKRAVRDALIAWARRYLPEQRIDNLMDFLPALDEETADLIRALNSCLYDSDDADWDGSSLATAFARLPDSSPASASASSPIEPLYRD